MTLKVNDGVFVALVERWNFWVIRRGACFRLDTDGDKADTGGEASV